jgi:hypothetical protein
MAVIQLSSDKSEITLLNRSKRRIRIGQTALVDSDTNQLIYIYIYKGLFSRTDLEKKYKIINRTPK